MKAGVARVYSELADLPFIQEVDMIDVFLAFRVSEDEASRSQEEVSIFDYEVTISLLIALAQTCAMSTSFLVEVTHISYFALSTFPLLAQRLPFRLTQPQILKNLLVLSFLPYAFVFIFVFDFYFC